MHDANHKQQYARKRRTLGNTCAHVFFLQSISGAFTSAAKRLTDQLIQLTLMKQMITGRG